MSLAALLTSPQLSGQLGSALLAEKLPVTNPYNPEPTGIFGLKGTARDVIGRLGDAFLIANRMAPMYGPQRQKEQLTEAYRGFEQDPAGAIQRIAEIDPTRAEEMRRALFTQQSERMKAEAAARKDSLAGAKDTAALESRFYGLAAGLAADPNSSTWPARKAAIEKLATKGGYTLPFALPTTYSADIAGQLRAIALDPDKRESLDETARYHRSLDENADETRALGERRLTVQDENADASRELGYSRLSTEDANRDADREERRVGRTTPRPAAPRAARGAGGPAPFRVTSTGEVLYRQPDGSYKKK